MDATKHTEGPWGLDGIAIGGSDPRAGDVCLMGEPARYPGDIPLMLNNWQANARLIAAAPDLLAALQWAVACGMVPKSSAKEGGAVAYAEQARCADAIRAAIARATQPNPANPLKGED